MREPIVFYSRCKPRGRDAIEIVLDSKRVFIGYPMSRVGAPYNPRNLKSCVIDLTCDDDEWETARAASDMARQYNQNRNLVNQVGIGSIALVPRPDRGVIYCGRIISNFELIDTPPWYDRYMEIRDEDDGPEDWHAADVAQCWKVDEFKPVPLPQVPAWIRRSLFGRSTYGRIYADQIGGDPFKVICKILESGSFDERHWTLDIRAIEKRLLEDLTPSSFEHLVVSLFQLEHPDEVWMHVGGSGDGGVDGVGVGQNGCEVNLLQCKWQHKGEPVFPNNSVWGGRVGKRYLAALRYPEGNAPLDCEFLDRQRIAKLVAKHYSRLPQALSMRIGIDPKG